MTTFLFWNVHKMDLSHRLARLILAHQVDVLLIAESPVGAAHASRAISAAGGPSLTTHELVENEEVESKVLVLSRFESAAFREKYTDMLGRLRIYEVVLRDSPEFLLAVAHLPSQRSRSREGLSQSATMWAEMIRDTEHRVGHLRTILVGDLNLNPFDVGMVSGHGFHAVMTRRKAEEGSRKIDGKALPFFYNPMWGFFGDQTTGPPGTYYLSSSDPLNYF
jgi:endonuclease/exonuclease/phosphatase family metal-dependent hydrolase